MVPIQFFNIENEKKNTLVYRPNIDSPEFCDNIMSIVDDFEIESYIIGSDLDIIQNPQIEYCNYKLSNNTKARDSILEIIGERSLIHSFRELYPNSQRLN